MPTPTYTPLATVTLATTTSSVTFGSIPATYRDLILVCSFAYPGSNASYVALRFNGDSGGNYNRVSMEGNGSTASSFSESGASAGFIFGGFLNTNPTSVLTQIMDYSATDKHKTYLSRGNSSSAVVGALAGRWANTAAITSVQVIPTLNNFYSGTTISLYGVIA
jgi:hypothetical protein